jgi:hypothetical protein
VHFVANAWAQGTAQMHGVVQDATGAAIPAADVKATQTDTGVVRTFNTGADGSYVLTNLPIGPYRLEVTKAGFAAYSQAGILLQVNGNPTVDVALKVGAVTEEVNVSASANLVETRDSSVGTVVENERILDLPLNGRLATDLIQYTGAAVAVTTTGARAIAGSPMVAIAGGLPYGVGYSLDGANHFNLLYATTNPMPFPDALQEFKVDTSGTSPTEARSASVSAVTKAGTNRFHGDAFEFIRNGDLNGRNMFAATQDPLKRNQFGGTVGGPIKKDKLFFFVGFQETTTRANPPSTQAFVPTAQMLAGDWTAFASPSCNANRQLNLGGPFASNTINPSLYNSSAVAMLNKVLPGLPTPNQCGLVTYGVPTHENDYQGTLRIDYQITEKHSIFGRFLDTATNTADASASTTNPLAIYSNAGAGSQNRMYSVVVGDTYLFRPNVVNSFRISTSRAFYTLQAASSFSACNIGINIYCGYSPNDLNVAITNGITLSTYLGNGSPDGDQNFNLNEDVSFLKGAHQFAFGVNPRIDYIREADNYYSTGQFRFTGQYTGSGLSDFLLGDLSGFTQAAPFYMYAKEVEFGAYAMDTWKVLPRLTVNLGLRWEPFFPEVMVSGQTTDFSLAGFYAGKVSSVYPSAPPGMLYPGDPGFPGGKAGSNPQWKQFAPRVGMAWDPEGNGKMSVRASAGLGYALIGGHVRENQLQNAPFLDLTGITPQLGSFSNPWTGFSGGNPFPIKSGVFSPYADYMVFPQQLENPSVASWNLNVQRQLGTDWLVSATYLGSETTHLWTMQPLNPAVYMGTGACTIDGTSYTTCSTLQNTNQRRVLNLASPSTVPLGPVTMFSPTGTASYNGLLLSAQHRLSRDFSLQANYTWSHCLSDFDSNPGMQAATAEVIWTNPNDRSFDRGPCASDRRQALNVTGLAQVPKFSNRVLGMLASGWQIAPIYRATSGQPLNILAGSDRALNGGQDFIVGGQYERANQVSSNVYGSSAPYATYLNPAAFAMPALGTLGNAPANGYVAPDYWQFDLALSRQFRIREGQRLEIRAEAFNILNKYRPGTCVGTTICTFLASSNVAPGGTQSAQFTSLTSSLFGQIRTAMDPRIMQFALKYFF